MNATLFRKPDFWIGLTGILLSLFLFAQTHNLSGGAVSDSVGAAFFPRLLLGMMLFLCVLLILRTRNTVLASEQRDSVNPAITTVIAVGLYAVVMPYIGYYPSTAALIATVLWIAGMRRLLSILLVVVILLAFEFAVFDRAFGVLFPTSVLAG